MSSTSQANKENQAHEENQGFTCGISDSAIEEIIPFIICQKVICHFVGPKARLKEFLVRSLYIF